MVISINLHQISLHSNRNTIHTHPSMYTHIHIHMHGHTYTHTYTYTHMHAHTHTCTHMDTQPCTHKHTHTHVYTDTHTRTQAYTHKILTVFTSRCKPLIANPGVYSKCFVSVGYYKHNKQMALYLFRCTIKLVIKGLDL